MFDLILHLDKHLVALAQEHALLVYALPFIVIFCETGLVITPFLPGDSLLFAIGSLAAIAAVDLTTVLILLSLAAICGDSVNYWVGARIGAKIAAMEKPPLIRKEYIARTHAFYERHGGKTIVIARFVPIIRTFAPFVAGTAQMRYHRFLMYNVFGGVLWVLIFTLAGFFFGNIPFVKEHFSLIALGIIVISVLPALIEILRQRRLALRQRQ